MQSLKKQNHSSSSVSMVRFYVSPAMVYVLHDFFFSNEIE